MTMITTTTGAAGQEPTAPPLGAPGWFRRGVAGAVSLGLVAGLAMTAEAAAAPVPPAGQTVALQADGRLRVQVADGSGATGTVILGLQDGRFSEVTVDAVVSGRRSHEVFTVDTFLLTGGENFRADLRAASTQQVMPLDSRAATQQAFPALLILGVLARLGIRWVIRWYGKTQVKKAAKSYLLNNISAHKWSHIMMPKHRWGAVDARSKQQVAELMSRAMAEGSHSSYRNSSFARQAVWPYRGQTIVVTYAKQTGQISDGWVR